MTYKTEQESFWAGEFGTDYINRNQGDALLASNLNFFSKSLRQASNFDSCIEFGANIGMNLRALSLLYPNLSLKAIEINKTAAETLSNLIGSENVYNESILDLELDTQHDLVLIKGVLIHQNPEVLPEIYNRLYSSTRKYILIAEYYNPTPVAIPYRSHKDRLFKRDFAGEMLDQFPNLNLVDYGFSYRRDRNFPQDDITWFLLEKQHSA